jgi:hypothetical protein
VSALAPEVKPEEKMKALVLTGFGGPENFVLRDIPKPHRKTDRAKISPERASAYESEMNPASGNSVSPLDV